MQRPADRPIHSLEEIRGKFDIVSKIGEGAFSSVFKASPVDEPNSFVALKRLFPISSPNRIQNEIKHLITLGGKSFVVPLLGGLRVKDQVTLIFPYMEHVDFKEYYRDLDIEQVSYYMHCLFTALAWVHDNLIIHRDVKPGNCCKSLSDSTVFTLKPLRFMLIDFGLAQSAVQDTDETRKRRVQEQDGSGPKVTIRMDPADVPVMERRGRDSVNELERDFARTTLDSSVPSDGWRTSSISNLKVPIAARAGTRGFRAPEILLKSMVQTPAIDIWSAGIIFLSFLSSRYPFFLSPDDLTGLAEISSVVGTEAVQALGEQLGKKIHFRASIPSQDWNTVCRTLNPDTIYPDEAYDLLQSLLHLDPGQRLTARDALKHRFFQQFPPFDAMVD